jgi:Domain of unknown function (DUF5666)
MKQKILCLIMVMGLIVFPSASLAAGPKTLNGVVTQIVGNQIIFAATSAAKYSADAGSAQLLRKNGAAMLISEIIPGDKIQVTGNLWGDNSISATTIRDLSLYAHTGTYSGKISAIDPIGLSFTMQSKTYGNQTIYTNNFTSFSKNNSGATFKDLNLGMTASVKGMWDRTNTIITATVINGSYRLIDIYFTGNLYAKNGSSFTVIGNGNVIYGVDASSATLQSKNGKPISLAEFKVGDAVRVWGKHLSGGVAVTGTTIKDSSITK